MNTTQRLRTLALAASALLLGGADYLQEDRLKCEEAAKRLADCCPNFDPARLQCGGSCQSPRLTIAMSECVLALDCPGVRAAGWCALRDPGGTADAGGVQSCE